MAGIRSISLPTLPEGVVDARSFAENFIIELLRKNYGGSFNVEKYYKTANQEIYTDLSNQVQSGVPCIMVRSNREDTELANPAELADDKTIRIEILFSVPVAIEKRIKNVDRYTYTMNYLCRELLRDNPLIGLPKNRRRPFVYLGNRDIFRDDDLDILLAEYNVNYITF